MSLRRAILPLVLGSLALTGLGLRDWAIESGRAMAFANRALAGSGLALTAEGPSSLTLLPVPRLAFARARLATDAPGGEAVAEGGRLTVDLDLLNLLGGRVAMVGAAFDGARLSPDIAIWAGPLARFVERVRADALGRPRRIAITGATLGDGAEVRDLDIDVAWSFWSAAAEARASLTWRGVPARIALNRLRPADVAGGRRSPFALAATWPGGSFAADGTLAPTSDGSGLPELAGRARFETRSLPETLAWLTRDAPLSPLVEAFTLDGDFEGAGRSISWPRVSVGIGSNVLEGAGSLALGAGEAPRLSAQATLAADTLNLAPLLGAVMRLLEPEPSTLALAPLTRGDLDLRLSAATGRIGPVQVEDLAASVLVREATVEVAVNRARIQGGTLKGRIALTSGLDPDETEVRVQAGLDRLDLGGLMGQIGEARWLQGPVQGQLSLESGARDVAGLLARVSGRASLAIEGGAISGLDLADVVHRNGAVAPGALARRNGRTGFERASVALRFSEGVGEITEATLRGAGVGATLRGLVSLPARRIDAQVDLSLRPPADPSRGVLFEISGPWDAPTARVTAHAESADPSRSSESGPLGLPAALGLSGAARTDAP